jgi:hypothetical protein
VARTSRRALDSTAFDLFETLSGPFERFTRSTFESLSRARPGQLVDFNLNEDVIDLIEVTNTLDPALSLDTANIKTIDIPGGSALIYDAPVDVEDFCFARFKGISAWELQVHVDQNTAVV